MLKLKIDLVGFRASPKILQVLKFCFVLLTYIYVTSKVLSQSLVKEKRQQN